VKGASRAAGTRRERAPWCRPGEALLGSARRPGAGRPGVSLTPWQSAGREPVANECPQLVETDTRTQSRSQLRAVTSRASAAVAESSCRFRGGRMPAPGESSPRIRRRLASRVQTRARNEAARHAMISKAEHQCRSGRGEPCPRSRLLRLVPKRFRKSECLFAEPLMLGYSARRLVAADGFGNRKFCQAAPHCQDRSHALSFAR
jgi:hypothetical protein